MKRTVLVVEDDRDMQRIYLRILSDKYRVVQAYDTKQAWKYIANEDIDLIILDIILPKGETGDKFYVQLSQNQAYSSIPVLFATVIDDQVEAGAYHNINNADWITKPFKEEELLRKLEEKLNRP